MNKDFAKGMIVSLALKSLPVRKKSPIAYLYNGIRLPKLPEWDREKYPYVVMWHNNNGEYGAVYAFSTPHHLTTLGIGIGVSKGESYLVSEWGGFLGPEPFVPFEEKTATGTANFTTTPCWANYDVLTNDGTLYLAKSTPIPIYNEPVNYLYNGVKLPKLPEWDKTVYPYATLRYQNGKDSSTTEYIFLFVTAQDYSWKSSYELQTYGPGYIYRYLIDGGTEWEYVREIGSNSEDDIANYFFWTTHDILNKDGDAVYLAASEPIPVYE